jgi:hypothetical protein
MQTWKRRLDRDCGCRIRYPPLGTLSDCIINENQASMVGIHLPAISSSNSIGEKYILYTTTLVSARSQAILTFKDANRIKSHMWQATARSNQNPAIV